MNFDNIVLEKGMYTNPDKSFSEILEELDPSAQYAGTEYEGLDAFGRQLKRFDIKVSGAGSDCISKFFSATQSAALFPEYISRAVRQGMEDADMLSGIVAATTRINSLDYRTIASVPSDDEKELKRVEEGAFIPETVVKTRENLVKLHKRGRMLVASYEALKYQKIDLFSVTLRQIGAHIARSQFADAVNVLISGDGNSNPASQINAATSGTLSYQDLLSLYKKLDPYVLNRLVMSPTTMMQLMNLSEFKNPLTGINFQGTGNPGNPLGAKVLRSSAVDDNKIIGLDAGCALEKVVASDISIDYDKLIDRQLERAVITTTAGFAKIFNEASAVLKI